MIVNTYFENIFCNNHSNRCEMTGHHVLICISLTIDGEYFSISLLAFVHILLESVHSGPGVVVHTSNPSTQET